MKNISTNPLLKNQFDIVFITSIFLDGKDNYFAGGGEIHLKNICHVCKKDKTILVIQMTNSRSRFVSKDGLLVYLVKCRGYLHFKIKIRSLLHRLNTKHVHFNYIGLETLIRKRKKIIYSATFHGTGWDFPVSNFPEPYVKNNLKTIIGARIRKRWMVYEQNQAVKKLDKIISVDSSLLRYCQQFFPSLTHKVFTLPNSVDFTYFTPTGHQHTDFTSDKFKILFPRNISFARGMHLLVPLALRLRAFSLPFVIQVTGGGLGYLGGIEYEDKLNSEISRFNLQDNFEFKGRIIHQGMPSHYRQCDLVIIPSAFSEGTSLSCLEAMSCRKIVLASNVGGLNDLIIDGYNGFLSDPNADSFSKRIKFIYDNFDQLHETIVTNASGIVSTCYSSPKWEARVRTFFNNTKL